MTNGTGRDSQLLEPCVAALKAVAVVLGWQIDPVRLHADLQVMAELARRKGQADSADLIDEIANTVEAQLLTTRMSIERTIIPFR